MTRALTSSLPVRAADRARWVWLKALGPLAKPLVRDRELRVAVAGTTLTLGALLGALFFPMWMLALGPIVWGTPHVVGDLRYLVVRPGLHRRLAVWALIGGPLLAVSVTSEAGVGFLAMAGAGLAARGAWPRRAAVTVGGLALAAAALQWPYGASLVFAHAHNFVAVGLFWVWRPRRGRLHFAPLLAFAVGGALLLSGVAEPLLAWSEALYPRPGQMDVYFHLASLAPGVEGPLAVRLVLLFCFAQSMHYVVWVRLVPEEDRPRETPRTFRASLEALADDFGAPLLVAAIAVTLGVAVWAAFDVFAARTGYLRAVLFHGHLELAIVALLIAEGRRPGAGLGPAAEAK